jgi:hypothetical protein
MASRQASKKSDADVGHLDYGLDVAQKVFQELQSEESEIVFGGLERPRGFQVRSDGSKCLTRGCDSVTGNWFYFRDRLSPT